MRIALTVKGVGLGAWLDDDFAHCGHVMIIDEDNQFRSWPNPYRDGDENPVIELSEKIITENIDVLVTSNISERIRDIFKKAGVKVMVKEGGAVFDLVEEARNLK